ncbi:MAG: glycosyltransferase family 4 protein [Ardenticatenaceae bacterium]
MHQRIALDATSALAQGAGIGRFTRGLIQGLAACDRATPYQVLYMRDVAHQPRFDLPPNFEWRELPLTQKQAVWLWQRLRLPLPAELFLRQMPALYHSPDYTLPPLLRARGIVTVHDLSYEVVPEVHEPLLRRYLQRAVPRSIARADHVFADSESTRQDIIRHYGTDPTKISVVYPGVEPRFRPLDPGSLQDANVLTEVRAAYELDRPFLLNVSTLEPRKNLTTLIRAFARLHEKDNSDLMLVIAGGGGWLGERARLAALVQELRMVGHVRFAGFIPDEWLPALLNLAEVLIYPSRHEGFGLPVLEALACGVPAITARNSSLSEVGGTAAHYIANATDIETLSNEIEIVLTNQAERERMIRAGLKHAAQFTWEATARRALALYRDVLAS